MDSDSRVSLLEQSLVWHLGFFTEELGMDGADVAQILRDLADWLDDTRFVPASLERERVAMS